MRPPEFRTRLVHCSSPAHGMDPLPFAVGAATQSRPEAFSESQNNQDGVSLCFGKSVFSGVIADGCSGTHPDLESFSSSSNEVGARLFASYAARLAVGLVEESGGRVEPGEFLESLSKSIDDAVSKLCAALCMPGAGLHPEHVATDFLATTLVGFAVTPSSYLVFHCGDGIAIVNGVVHELQDSAQHYLSNRLLPGSQVASSLKLLAAGATPDLQSVCVATDGMIPYVRRFEQPLREFLTKGGVQPGLDYRLVREFRQSLAWAHPVHLTDDATFALARRVPGG